MKDPVIERKISQLRDGRRKRKFGTPRRCQRSSYGIWSRASYAPIIRRAGLGGGRGGGLALVDGTASWILLEAVTAAGCSAIIAVRSCLEIWP